MSERHNFAPDVKRGLVDVRAVCDALGLTAQGGKTVQRQAGGLILRCVWHEERSPSMSVKLGPDGTIAVKCFGCDRGGDVLSLVAAVRGLDLSRNFRDVLLDAARLGGMWQVVDAIEGRGAKEPESPRPAPTPAKAAPAPERTYPDGVDSFWGRLEAVTAEMLVLMHLSQRAIDPELVEARDLARSIGRDVPLPSWAVCRGGDWHAAGFRLVIPMFDPAGAMRSVRGWRVLENDLPKRLPPSGHKASGLVMADEWGRAMLAGTRAPERVVIAEGEPDWLTWATRLNDPRTAVLGIVSGTWTPALAERFPVGARVDVWTDHDEAGDRYAGEIAMGLARRCFVHRQEGTR